MFKIIRQKESGKIAVVAERKADGDNVDHARCEASGTYGTKKEDTSERQN
jgi:hypothetical protein